MCIFTYLHTTTLHEMEATEEDHLCRFLTDNAPHLFTCHVNEHDIRNNTCYTCFGITKDKDDKPCDRCSKDKSIIKTWCNPRGRNIYQHPEARITNQQAPYTYIRHSWNVTNRNPKMIHPQVDFTGPVYEGYLDSLLVSLVLQMHNFQAFEPFNDHERHPFDLTFWKQHLHGIDSVLQELSGNMKFPDTLTVLQKTAYTLYGVNDKSIHYYGRTLWNKHLIPKLFANYLDIKNKFLGLFPQANATIFRQDSAHNVGSLASPPMQQVPDSQVPQQAVVVQPNGTRTVSPQQAVIVQANPVSPVDLMKSFEGIPSPGSLFNCLIDTTPEHTTRKRHVKSIYSNMNIHTSNDIISMLVEQKTYQFKSHKIQKLFDSYNFQAETLNLRMFNMLMGAITPDDLTDMNAICDHIGNYMIVQK